MCRLSRETSLRNLGQSYDRVVFLSSPASEEFRGVGLAAAAASRGLGRRYPVAWPEATRVWAECEPAGPCEEGTIGSPWVHRFGYDQDSAEVSVSRVYLKALLWASGTMTGTGSEIWGATEQEEATTVLVIIFSFFLCSWLVVAIMNMTQQLIQARMSCCGMLTLAGRQ